MTSEPEAKVVRFRKVLNLERADRLSMGDYAMVEYRPDIYHLGEDEPRPGKGQVARTRNGQRLVTHDGGVWAVDAKERYRTPDDVLGVGLARFAAEPVGDEMLARMATLVAGNRRHGAIVPLHYGTLVTRCTIEFGWEPFLLASALEPTRLARILDAFGEASLAVVCGWAQTQGVELIAVHDDIAGTRGLVLSPDYLRQYCLPWYKRLFAAIHSRGCKVLYVGDGNYLPFLEDLLTAKPDGLYIESSSMDPREFMSRAGADKLYLLKTSNQNADVGTPAAIRAELERLRDLHREYPGILMYRGGGNPPPGNAEAFDRYYQELLVYS
jgi:hypothetical protein